MIIIVIIFIFFIIVLIFSSFIEHIINLVFPVYHTSYRYVIFQIRMRLLILW